MSSSVSVSLLRGDFDFVKTIFTSPRTGDLETPDLLTLAYVNGDFERELLTGWYGEAANKAAVDALDVVRSVDGPGVP